MKKNNTSSSEKNNAEILIYSIVGGSIVLMGLPNYIPVVVFGSGLMYSLYEIIKILSKYQDVEAMNFVSKEKIKYFNKK